MRSLTFLVALAIVWFCPAPLALAQNAPSALQALDQASAAARIGDNKAALESIWAAQEALWNQAPLSIRNAYFVTEQPENFGSYKPRANADFQDNEPLIFYTEPYGFTQLKGPDGTYGYSINGAFVIIDSSEKTLGGQDNLGPYEMRGHRTFSVENMLAMTIGVKGLPPGSYTLKVTLTDNLNPAKTVSVTKPFRLVGDE
ncbi:MAG: hypothetical protein LBT38_08145 [Deltaproteobacteria bacterium]|jgi:hypothetical protein|nr:hypothetical protein [Deltaproteobacteria bacterium]